MTDQVPAEVVTVLKGFRETRQTGSVTHRTVQSVPSRDNPA